MGPTLKNMYDRITQWNTYSLGHNANFARQNSFQVVFEENMYFILTSPLTAKSENITCIVLYGKVILSPTGACQFNIIFVYTKSLNNRIFLYMQRKCRQI